VLFSRDPPVHVSNIHSTLRCTHAAPRCVLPTERRLPVYTLSSRALHHSRGRHTPPLRPQNKALEGRLFYKQSFSIYGGVAGLYDYGPPGTAVKSNITQFWRQHFVFAESMLELECPAVTPEAVLRPSGHVERFVDFMVKDELGNCLRADHVLEAKLEEIVADPKSSEKQKQVCWQSGLERVGPTRPTMLRIVWCSSWGARPTNRPRL
jgi:hypothetical protein